MAYYVVCREFTGIAEIEEMEGNLFLTAFRKMRFVNANKSLVKKTDVSCFSVREEAMR